MFLGTEGKSFEFTDLLPLRIEFAMASVQSNEMQEITNWLTAIA